MRFDVAALVIATISTVLQAIQVWQNRDRD